MVHYYNLKHSVHSFILSVLACVLQKVSVGGSGGDSWSGSLADFIRHNDQELLTQGDKLLKVFEEEILPCESFAEYCDVAGKERILIDSNSIYPLSRNTMVVA